MSNRDSEEGTDVPAAKATSIGPAGVGRSRSSSISSGDSAQKPGRGSRLRCAIYTRKSSEEGFDQEFNSLDAQREACDAYLRSQKHEGWQALAQRYDDPGYSGSNMDRPALARLLADIAAGKIDVVVVYKVDRLTRALADFAKIVEVFDASQVSFVSITQSFNTTTSMGRLTLNVLLSFAQFEREVTGERIRGKIAASKKKGLWMGGLPSLGYDVQDRKLVANPAEAAAVRIIFQKYLEVGSVDELKPLMADAGVVSKLRKAADGRPYGGNAIARGTLYRMLQNPIHRGEIVHKGTAYPSEHEAIIDEALWDAVQKKLEANGVERSSHRAAKPISLLASVLFDTNGEAMTPTHAVKKGVRYRYYVSRRLTGEKRKSDARGAQSGQRLPAIELERLVTKRLREFFADPDAIANALPPERRDAPSRKRALGAAQAIVNTIDKGEEDLTTVVLRPLLARVKVAADRIEIDLAASAINEALLVDDQAMLSRSAPSRLVTKTKAAPDDQQLIRLTIPARLQRAGHEMKFVVEGAENERGADPALLRLLTRAHGLARRIANNPSSTLEDISAQEGMGAPYAARLMRLNYLAPEIIIAILNGRQPEGVTATKLIADTRLPLDWSEQRREMGFA